MPDIGFLELVVVGAIAFLILGPERAPEFFAQISRFIRQGRAWARNLKQQIDEETQALKEPIQSARDALDDDLSHVIHDIDIKDMDSPKHSSHDTDKTT